MNRAYHSYAVIDKETIFVIQHRYALTVVSIRTFSGDPSCVRPSHVLLHRR